MLTCVRAYLFVAGLCLIGGWLGVAQPALADDPEVPFINGSATGAGLVSFRPERWGLVRSKLENPTDQAQQLRLGFSFQGETGRQFMVDTWLPGKSRRTVEWPVRLESPPTDPDARSLEGEVILFRPQADGTTEQLAREPGTFLFDDQTRHQTVVFWDTEDEAEGELMADARESQGFNRRLSMLNERFSPRFEVGWHSASVLMISTDEPMFDASQRRAIRQWFQRGGVVLVFADQVSPEAMRMLFGSAWTVSEVDQVSLTILEFQLTAESELSVRRPGAPEPVLGPLVVEDPLRMARVVAPGFRTLLTVRGWPALLERSVGNGRLLVSTVEGRAWVDESTHSVVTEMGRALYRKQTSVRPTVEMAAAREFVSRQVGHSVAPRSTIGIILGGLLGVVAVVALLLGGVGRLERLALVLVVGAGITVVVLLSIGGAYHGKIDPTNTSIQVVQARAGESAAFMQGVMGLYDPNGRTTNVISQAGGWAWPAAAGASTSVQRLLWSDLDRWQWLDLDVPTGAMRIMQFSTEVPLPRAMEMDLTLDGAGVAGSLVWPQDTQPTDLLIVSRAGAMVVQSTPTAGSPVELTSGPEQVLPAGTYATGAMLSQTQQMRTALIEKVMEKPGWPPQPMLLGWNAGLDSPIGGTGTVEDHAASLWVIPLELKRPRPGTAITVPWPLIDMHPVRTRYEGLRQMPIYQPDKQRFIEDGLSQPSAFIARFQLPPAASQLDITRAVVHLDIRAVERPVKIMTIEDGRVIDLAELDGPDGPQKIEVPIRDLSLDSRGGILMAFDVGMPRNANPAQMADTQMWQVRRFALHLEGTVK